LDESSADARSRLGFLYAIIRQHDKGIAEAEKAVALNPNFADAYNRLGLVLRYAGRPGEAIPVIKKAIRLNPFPTSHYYWNLGLAYLFTGQCEEAIAGSEKALQINTDDLIAHIAATTAYSMCDQAEKAKAAAEGILRINPKFSLQEWRKRLPYKNKADRDRYIAALRKAELPDTPPLPLPDKPSIAVLAFDNLSGDPEQEYLGDGIAEEIITALSKTEKLFVIARSSTFTYKEKPVKVQQVGRELGVKYVLEGSVRKDENHLRITAQLIDATTGHHLWAESYDRDLKDLFEVQDEITMKIVTAMRIKLTDGESARMWAKKTKLDVYKKQMEALSAWNKGTKEGHIRHGQLAQEVIDMAPELAIGYRLRTWYYWELVTSGIAPRENATKAFKLAQKALSMDENDSMAHAVLGGVYLAMRQYEKAIAEGKRAVELNPNGAFEHGLLGGTLSYAGRPDEAIDHIKQGIRLNPFPEYWYYLHLGRCYRQKGMYDKALTEFKKAHHLSPDSPPLNFALALAYSLLGRDEEAHAAVEKGLEINPKISSEFIAKISMYKNKEDTQQIIDALRKAGLPEKSPIALQDKLSKN
jgi:TolB-like protein/Tfp pilus assembly protein PilF